MLTIAKSHPLFAAEIGGVSLKDGCAPHVAGEIRSALHRYGVVALRGQHLTDAELEAFGAALGDPYQPTMSIPQGSARSVFRLSNIDTSGNILPADDRIRAVVLANLLWHTDSTYMRPRAEFSFLAAHQIPPEGGNTEFVDTRLAYESLPPALAARVETMTGRHSIIHSRKLTGYTGWSEAERAAHLSVPRPLVHFHKESGRKALCLAAHIESIDGMPPQDTQAFVDDLIARATPPERIHAHRWDVGDLVIWDNRCTMHRATAYEDMRYPRDMRSMRTNDLADAA